MRAKIFSLCDLGSSREQSNENETKAVDVERAAVCWTGRPSRVLEVSRG